MSAGVPPLGPAGFEALYRKDPDPWRTWTSPIEAHKRRMLIAACGPGGYGRVLELGCGTGANTAELARRALRVDAVDASTAALESSRLKLAHATNVRLRNAVVPAGLTPDFYDLVVIAEVAYYLSDMALVDLCTELKRRVVRGGRLVLLHHHIAFSDASMSPNMVHPAMIRRLAPTFRRLRRMRFRRWEVIVLLRRATEQ